VFFYNCSVFIYSTVAGHKYEINITVIPSYGTADGFLVRGKTRLPKVDHPKIEGHVTLNEDEYQKSVWETFLYCLGASEFTVSLLITCIPAEDIEFEIGYFRNFQTSVTLILTNL